MCNCVSCSCTDEFAGKGFAAWPRGEPKGSVTSAAEYRKHASHCGSAGLPKPWRFVAGRPPQFSTSGQVMPIPQAPRYVLDFIARGPKSTGPVLPGPDARTTKPAKASRHFPALNRQPETAVIYAMPKAKERKPRGRPSLPGRRVVIKLREEQIKRAEKLGGGNVAAGIRKALGS